MLKMYPPDNDINDESQATIRFEAGVAKIVAGGLGQDDTELLVDARGSKSFL